MGVVPPYLKNIFINSNLEFSILLFDFRFYFLSATALARSLRSWFRSWFFGCCLPQLPRSSLSSAAASLSLDLPGFFYCVLVRCCRFYALMLAIICLLLPGLPLGLLVPSWGCLLLGCICCPGRISPGGFYSLGASLYTRYNYIAPLYLTRLRIGGIFYNHFS